MRLSAVRSAVAGGVVVAGLGILLFAPAGGAVSISPFSRSFFDRLYSRYTAAEAGSIALLDCLAGVAAAVPDGSTMQITSHDDSYAQQRLTELSYPRVSVVGSGAEYDVRVDSPTSATPIASEVCGDRTVEVVKRG